MMKLIPFCSSSILLWFHLSLTLAAPERIFLEPKDPTRTVMVGKSTFVECTTKGTNVQRVIWTGPEGGQITSYDASVALNERRRVHVEDSSMGHRGAELHFNDVKRKDAGKYTCSAHVDGHDVNKSFVLKVEKAPDFSDTPAEQYLEEGSNSSLICNVDGFPEPSITWQKDGRYLFKRRDKFAVDKSNENWIIVINVTLEDAGKYVCGARQVSETTTNFELFEIQVIVHHKPLKFPDSTIESVSYLKGVVNLTCEAVAEPKANFTWMKDDQLLDSSEDVKIFNDSNKSILQVTVSNHSMFGDYICIAENHLGKLERVIPLEEGQKPLSPRLKVTQTGVNSLKLVITSDETFKGFKLEYKLAGQDWHNATVKNFDAGQKEYTLDGLENDKLYVMRAFSLNEAGYSDPTEDTFRRTLKNPLPLSGARAVSASAYLVCLAYLSWYVLGTT